jgi:hypothetical protein
MLEDWFKKNLLLLNTMETYCIKFTAKSKVERDIGNINTLIFVL